MDGLTPPPLDPEAERYLDRLPGADRWRERLAEHPIAAKRRREAESRGLLAPVAMTYMFGDGEAFSYPIYADEAAGEPINVPSAFAPYGDLGRRDAAVPGRDRPGAEAAPGG